MAEASRHRPVDWSGFQYVPLGMRRPTPPKPPSEAARADVEASGSQVAVTLRNGDLGVVAAPEPEQVVGVTLQLDIAVERRRSFWWRLRAALQVRRLG
jgi:hypothetical protein